MARKEKRFTMDIPDRFYKQIKEEAFYKQIKSVTRKEKRFVMDIPATFHKQIKEEALFVNMTMRKYVMEAILERLKKDLAFRK